MYARTNRYGQTTLTHVVEADVPASLRARVRDAFLTRVSASNPSWEAKAEALVRTHDLTVDDAARVVLAGLR